jgi:uncharacterized membrane protein YgdD (TMEM256/DUF423 family)
MFRIYAALGGLLGLIAVALSSYASHAMADASSADVRRITIAIAMQAVHALLLLVIATWLRIGGGMLVHAAAFSVLIGLALFCGSLYAAVFAGASTALAPAGGVLLMLGWLLFAIAALGAKR